MREVIEEPKRFGIGPVSIIDADEHRYTISQVDNEPIEAVEGREACVEATRIVRAGVEEARRQTRRAREQLGAIVLETDQDRLEQLSHHAECEFPLELHAAALEHPQP